MSRPARLLIGIVLAAGIFVAGYVANRQHGPAAATDSATQAPVYSCPMHPQYTSDRQGDCPTCGMRLEPAGGGGAGGSSASHVNIYAPVSGYVIARNLSPGQRFDKGTELYRIADISRLWLWTDIFEQDRQFLKPGAEATAVYLARRFKARMSDALLQFDTESRTLKTRFEIDNPGHVLQPDMFFSSRLSPSASRLLP